MAIFGYNSKKLATENIPNVTCKHCGTQEGFRVTLYSKYAHLSFIPAFPLGRPAIMECVHCKRTIGEKEFTAEQAAAVASLKAKHKSPAWTWSFLILAGLFVGGTTLYEALRTKSNEEKLLHADFDLMSTKQVQDQDSLAQLLSTFMGEFVSDEVNPKKFHYYTKQKGDHLLVLVEIPELTNSTDNAKSEALELVTSIVEKTAPKDSKIYVGLHANEVVKATKTPAGVKVGTASESDLYPFYAAAYDTAPAAPAAEASEKAPTEGKKRKK